MIAGRAGISRPYLSQLERGERALSRLSVIVALADALEIAPSELTKIPTPATGNGQRAHRLDNRGGASRADRG